MCKYSKGSWNCPYEKLPDSEYCIFHLEDENKNADEFNNRINELFDSNETYNFFIGFIFTHGTTKFNKKYFNKYIYREFSFANAKFLDEVDFADLEFSGCVFFNGATFFKKVYFDSSIFAKDCYVSFDNAKFLGTTSFHSTKFLGVAEFIDTEFHGKTYFINTEFGRTAYFSRAKFFKPELQEYDLGNENVEFDGAKFLSEARFIGTLFSVNVSFSKARFLEETNFSDSEFSKDTFFDNSEFIKSTYFYNAKFLGKISFYYATFSDLIGFNGAKFCKNSDADFGSAKLGETYFQRAKIFGKINFSNAKFFRYTNFNNTIFFKFPEKVNFENVEFSDDTYFEDVKFLRKIFFKKDKFINVCFNKAEFENVYFDDAIFSGETQFKDIKFLGEASFIRSDFSRRTIFKQCDFHRPVLFSFATFAGKFDFLQYIYLFRWDEIPGKDSVRLIDFLKQHYSIDWVETAIIEKIDDGKTVRLSFENNYLSLKLNNERTGANLEIDDSRTDEFTVKMENGKLNIYPCISNEIHFDNVFFGDYVRIKANLTWSYFRGSNIEIVDLTDSEWELKDNNSIVIWEDYQRELNYRELEGIYRRLKQSYQRHGNYSTSGKFYYREMDLHGDQLRFLDKLWWNIGYKYSCGYGEKPFNVFRVSIVIIILFASFYFYSGITIFGKDTINYDLNLISFNFSWINDFLWCLYMSITAFTTMGYGDVQPLGMSRLFASLEAGIGIFMTALFIFVFTRKMLR